MAVNRALMLQPRHVIQNALQTRIFSPHGMVRSIKPTWSRIKPDQTFRITKFDTLSKYN